MTAEQVNPRKDYLGNNKVSVDYAELFGETTLMVTFIVNVLGLKLYLCRR